MAPFCEHADCGCRATWRCRTTDLSGNPVDLIGCGAHAAEVFAASRLGIARWSQIWRVKDWSTLAGSPAAKAA